MMMINGRDTEISNKFSTRKSGKYLAASAAAFAFILVTGTAVSPTQAAVALIDFESTPPLSTGPSIYVAVPGPQTITTTPATFTGGVVLGFATFFPAISFATAPNVYGTANFGNGLPEALNVAINPAFSTTEVSFALFNGEVFSQSYAVNAFNGTTLVANQTLTNVAPNFNSGYGLIDLVAPGGITSLTVTPVGAPSAWDFLIDTVAFNQSISTIVLPPVVQPPAPPVTVQLPGRHEPEAVEVDFGDDVNNIRGSFVPAPTPEPGSLGLMVVGLGLVGFKGRRRMNAPV